MKTIEVIRNGDDVTTRHIWQMYEECDKVITEYSWKVTRKPEEANYWIALADGFLYLISTGTEKSCIAIAEDAAGAITGKRVLLCTWKGGNWVDWQKKWKRCQKQETASCR